MTAGNVSRPTAGTAAGRAEALADLGLTADRRGDENDGAPAVCEPDPTADVLPFPSGLDAERRERLQIALDNVPIALGWAAGAASILLPYHLGTPARARRRLVELCRLWHADVDRSIDNALVELAT